MTTDTTSRIGMGHKHYPSDDSIRISASFLLEVDDEEFKGYYASKNAYKVYGPFSIIEQVWDRAKKLSVY